MKIYTRTGDTGETSLLGGARVSKHHDRIESYGTVDELNSQIGFARSQALPAEMDAQLARVQADLFDIGAALAAPDHRERFPGVKPDRIEALEQAIDRMEEVLEPLSSFILPGGCAAAAALHIARTICRRAERRVVALDAGSGASQTTIAYLNRLADYLFVAARAANHAAGVDDVKWTGE